ncbi:MULTISPECIES: substrate-binding periplasmic protein [Aquitalea]|uniref:Amino acid ABC transporter substrate-binding protein (PAAT family) n=1 Tax=Aquitalea magnusonii TaxID=332411 RepID=A0A318JNE1_9NEIS|nr:MULTISPECIES: transporter substrate-binding domain-containing protein [Aquitalea]PXX50491.1 amino acid ABC transporter substrate-binding protein (PAAT family) [Aquitalea magnusonii]
MFCRFTLLFQAAVLACMLSNIAHASGTVTISVIQNDPVDAVGFRIIKEAYRRIGMTALASPLPSKRAIAAADSGSNDGDAIRAEGMEIQYPHLLRVPEPVMSIDTYAFTTQAEGLEIKGWNSLRGHQVCIRQGIFLQEAKTNQLLVSHVVTIADAIRMLIAGRCDVATLSKWAWLEIAEMHAGNIRQLQPALASNRMYHYLNIRNAHLLAPLAQALQQMKADGTMTILENKDKEVIEAAMTSYSRQKVSQARSSFKAD